MSVGRCEIKSSSLVRSFALSILLITIRDGEARSSGIRRVRTGIVLHIATSPECTGFIYKLAPVDDETLPARNNWRRGAT